MLLSPVSSKTGVSSRLLTLILHTDVPVGIIRGHLCIHKNYSSDFNKEKNETG